MAAWLAEQRKIYFGNANSVKEYRIQLRSVKTVWYWGVYLGILVLVAVANYSSIMQVAGSGGPSAVQTALIAYYQMVTGFVNAGILLIAPMIAASGIVSEYELRSIELVQCAPTSTKYFFVGKFIACLRQILLLLFLALPIAAVGVTLGGATWAQILEQFAFIAMQGCLVAAVALPIAVATKSIIRTVVGVIGSGVVFTMFMTGLGASVMAFSGGLSVPPFAGLIPFAGALAVGQSFPIMGTPVPLWFITLVLTVILIKVLLLGAGSALTRVGSKETINLRIHGLFLMGLYAMIAATTLLAMPPSMSVGGDRVRDTFLGMGIPMLLPLFLVLIIGAHGRLEERKFFADRFFELGDTLRGRPSGALGYSFLMLVILGLGTAVPMLIRGSAEPLTIGLIFAWGMAMGLFLFGLVWWVSTFFDQAVGGRRMAFGALIGVGAVLHFTGIAIDASMQSYSFENTMLLNVFLPYATANYVILVKALVLAGAGIGLLVMGERRRKKNLQILKDSGYLVDRDELIQQTA